MGLGNFLKNIDQTLFGNWPHTLGCQPRVIDIIIFLFFIFLRIKTVKYFWLRPLKSTMYTELRSGGISSIQIDKSGVKDARRAKACASLLQCLLT